MVAFDSPSREFCVSRRIRTNTPLQALVTLNDTVYLEASEGLAHLMKQLGKGDIELSIRKGYQRALLAYPDDETMEILLDLYENAKPALSKLVALDSKDKIEPNKMLTPLSVVANAIMNLDAFLTKS